MLFCINFEFRGLKLQPQFFKDVLFLRCSIFPQLIVICLHLIENVSLDFNICQSNFQDRLNHYFSWTSFYSKSEIVEGCHKM